MYLSKTQFTVSAHITAGYEVKEIAAKLNRSYHTVASHVKTIRLKNNLKNLAEISREFALEFGDPRHYIAMVFCMIQPKCRLFVFFVTGYAHKKNARQ